MLKSFNQTLSLYLWNKKHHLYLTSLIQIIIQRVLNDFSFKTSQGVIHKLRNAVRGGEGQPLRYAMMNMVSKMVYYVLRRGGGGGQNMFKMALRN